MSDSPRSELNVVAAGAAATPRSGEGAFPVQPLHHLDALWLQVAGSRCNLTCAHCFVSCGPEEHRHEAMSRSEVARHVAAGVVLGVREFYFTGGEPFLHPELLDILADTLPCGPCTVLTNGTLLTERRVAALRALSDTGRFTLELRVSFDGASPAEHDPIRGAGSFARALDGVRRLADASLLPIVTVTQLADEDPLVFRDRWVRRLVAAGVARPRLKLLPLFRLGREVGRTRGYRGDETLAALAPDEFDPHRLQCGTCRAVTSRGVFVCPLLVDEPVGRMGDDLAAALGPFRLAHGACTTCYATGMTCGNG